VLPDSRPNCEFLTSNPTLVDVVSSYLLSDEDPSLRLNHWTVHVTPSPSPHSSSHGRWKRGVLIGLVLSKMDDHHSPESFMTYVIVLDLMPLIVHSDLEIKLLVLRTAGILFPILVMVRALASFHRRRRQQVISSLNLCLQSHCANCNRDPVPAKFSSSRHCIIARHTC
jgi:hypothetical protein